LFFFFFYLDDGLSPKEKEILSVSQNLC